MTAPPPDADPLHGAVLDRRYRVDGPIGAGGMCVVYRGFDQRLQRPVAIKIAAPRFRGDTRVAERFDREARAVARLSDPGLVAVYDQGSVDGRSYLVLEHVDGGTARALLAERGAMPPYAAAAVLSPVLRALAAAHGLGFVHGDVKPENVLISAAGEVKLADFGSVTPTPPWAGTGWTQHPEQQTWNLRESSGTVGYLAPEQVDPTKHGQVSPEIDVYAAGVMLYELLTGELPFCGTDPAQVARARLAHDVPPPSRAVDGVPLQFDHLVLRATERDLRARYRDARAMVKDLERARAELLLPEYTVPAPKPQRQPAPAPLRHATAPVSSALNQQTVDLTTVIARPEPETGPQRLIAANPGVPPAKTLSPQNAAVWLVVVLTLAVLAVLLGWDIAAILEHELR